MEYLFSRFSEAVDVIEPVKIHGKICEVIGLIIESTGPAASIGDICTLEYEGKICGRAEVVGFRKERTLLMPLGTIDGIHPGYTVVSTKKPLMVKVGPTMLGRVLNGIGEPMDGKGPILAETSRSVLADIPNPLSRNRIEEVFQTSIKALDTMLTIGKGQRLGIFAGSGVGKSVLLGMLTKYCKADVNVIVLVGERGREVREFIERDLGEEGLRRSVLIIATSDQPALIRVKASMVGAAVAEYFRDQGNDVLFMCDSVTRLAMAQREIGLAVGEPPATKGFTPSVFSILPLFLERAGNSDKGSITGLFTVLVEGGDMEEPIADAVRGIVDGHIVLSRKLAHRNHFPAIDILQSISRCQNDICSEEHLSAVSTLKDLMAAYKENEDLIQIGAYTMGTNPRVDKAIQINDTFNSFLRQRRDEALSFEESLEHITEIHKLLGGA